jgi:NCAIR mutase (PurE)-related protein
VNVPTGPKKPTEERGMGEDAVAAVTTGQDRAVDAVALSRLLAAVRDGHLRVDDAVAELRRLPYADLGFARVDHHRALRQGRAETVYGPGKTAEQAAAIVTELLTAASGPVLLSRATDGQAATAVAANAGGEVHRHGPGHSTVVWRPAPPRSGRVLVVTAGTADLPVADECAVTLAAHGVEPERLTDVGVAGIHRLLAVADRLAEADAVVVVAGMEGALASVAGGLTGAPVVAVPTSVGYGASLEGVTALLGMLASCASGLTVVGIDNGFGAACAVLRLLPLRLRDRARIDAGA